MAAASARDTGAEREARLQITATSCLLASLLLLPWVPPWPHPSRRVVPYNLDPAPRRSRRKRRRRRLLRSTRLGFLYILPEADDTSRTRPRVSLLLGHENVLVYVSRYAYEKTAGTHKATSALSSARGREIYGRFMLGLREILFLPVELARQRRRGRERERGSGLALAAT